MLSLVKRYQTALYILGTALITSFPASAVRADTLIAADDPRINYYGRFDFTNPSSPRWNWSGSTIEACFSGPSVGIGLVDGKSDYDIEIDGVVDTVIRTKDNIERYNIGSFSNTMHVIRIVQRSENHASAATFKGFFLADGKTLGNAPTKPARKIEFIGNSDLVAYGVESNSNNCTNSQLRSYTNTNRSYGMLVAKAFNAQSVILGWSGKGIVRNSDSPSKRSSTSFPTYYDKTLGLLDTKWDFTKWIPDLVTIILGWNDFASSNNDASKYPDDTMFIGDYHKFIDTIRGHYPDAAVLCVTTHNGRVVDYVKQVVVEETTSLHHSRVYYAEYPLDESFKLTGCLGHPAPDDHRLIAQMIIDTVQRKLGWDTMKTTVKKAPYCSRETSSEPGLLSVYMIGRQTLIIAAASSGTENDILLHNVDGRIIKRAKFDRGNRVAVSIANLPPGIYIIGNLKMGWKRFAIMQ